jgi:hypothetical protein
MSDGGSSSQTVGFRYAFGIHMGIGLGPIDELVEAQVGERTAWRGSVTTNTQIAIEAYDLFGGESGEGGVQGTLDVMMGGPTQTAAVASPKLVAMHGGAALPGYRRRVTAFFDGIVSMINPYPKPWKFRQRRALSGWDGDVFYPDKAVVPILVPAAASEIPDASEENTLHGTASRNVPVFGSLSSITITLPAGAGLIAVQSVTTYDRATGTKGTLSGSQWSLAGLTVNLVFVPLNPNLTVTVNYTYSLVIISTPQFALIKAMNPAHIVYECLTNREWGRGLAREVINEASFTIAADLLFNEGFGLCIKWARRDEISNFIQSVLDHIGATLYTDRTTALLTLTLIRGDYVMSSLPLYDPSNGLLEIREASVSSFGPLVNEMMVSYHDPISDKDKSVTVQSVGALQASGGRFRSVKRTYSGLPSADLATRVAHRDLKASGVALRRFTLICDRRAYATVPGSVIRVRDLPRGIPEMAVRVGRVETGTQQDGKITLTVVQDVFSFPLTSFTGSEPARWIPPNIKPCLGRHRVFEVPYAMLARASRPADFAMIGDEAAYLGACLEQGQSLNAGYAFAVRNGAPTVEDTPPDDAYYCGYTPP